MVMTSILPPKASMTARCCTVMRASTTQISGRRKYLQTLARATPVLPDVDSMMVVLPGMTRPSRMAASSIEAAARSLLLPIGLSSSSLA